MMKDLKDKWDKLLILRIIEMKTFKNGVIILLAAGVVTIGRKRLIFGSKTIIDDILLRCDRNEIALTYFRCVREVFKKYRVFFCLDKYNLLKPRVEYVGHNILCKGNCPAQSKFNLINN